MLQGNISSHLFNKHGKIGPKREFYDVIKRPSPKSDSKNEINTAHKAKQKYIERQCRCKICGAIMLRRGIYTHLKIKHGKAGSKEEFYEILQERKLESKIPSLPKEIVPNTQTRTLITPEVKYIDIPVVLRIPLTLGSIQILAQEER